MIFMPKYGHPKRHLVTWAEYSMLIGRDQFCFAVIGQSLLEPLSLLSELSLALPTLLLRLIVVCPKHIEFCADSCCRYVGLLFCLLHERTWQKWLSTPSWLTRAGLILMLGIGQFYDHHGSKSQSHGLHIKPELD